LIISLAGASFLWLLQPALAGPPTDYVRGILDRVMTIQTNPSLSTQQRAGEIHRIIENSFDFNRMAQDILGSTYGRLSASQRQEFTRTFSYLFQDSYTRLVLNFLKQENIQYGAEQQQGGTAKVSTTIVRPNERIPVTYLLHRGSQGWILHDVVVDGVSILQNYKSQFGQVIQTHSFEYLLKKMEEQRRAVQ
jgi:phospholipid transport system substrate-binding protein